jgi:hypothetical protein
MARSLRLTCRWSDSIRLLAYRFVLRRHLCGNALRFANLESLSGRSGTGPCTAPVEFDCPDSIEPSAETFWPPHDLAFPTNRSVLAGLCRGIECRSPKRFSVKLPVGVNVPVDCAIAMGAWPATPKRSAITAAICHTCDLVIRYLLPAALWASYAACRNGVMSRHPESRLRSPTPACFLHAKAGPEQRSSDRRRRHRGVVASACGMHAARAITVMARRYFIVYSDSAIATRSEGGQTRCGLR